MIKSLLTLTERRLDRAKQEQWQVQSAIRALQQQLTDIQSRIAILTTQIALYEQSAKLSKMAFWESQRLKAALLAEIAHLQYQTESINTEMTRYEQSRKNIVVRMFALRNKCEKFQNYLKQQHRARRLKSERQQQNEIEELSAYGNSKTGVE